MFCPSLLSRSVTVAITLICAPGITHAQTARDLDSHEHGAANLNVVIDGNSVFLEFESPWNNLVGFEHSPSTDGQREAVESAMQTLAAPEAMFAFNDDAGCTVSSAAVESSLDADGDHDHADHDDHAHDEHKEHDDQHAHDDHKEHDDEHAHDGHKEHDDEHAHGDHKEHGDEHAHNEDDEHDQHDHAAETHSEAVAMYAYECTNPDKIESLEVKLFDLYSGFEEITYQAAGPSGQTGSELTASNTTLDLSGVR